MSRVAKPPVTEAQWARILDGRKVRYLVTNEQIEWAGANARFCLSCAHVGKPSGDPRRAWCPVHRMMTSNAFPVLCKEAA